jgi:hypothetical protein
LAKKSKIAAAEAAPTNPDDEAECFRLYCEERSEIARIQQRIGLMLGRFSKMGVDTKSVKYAYSQAQKEDVEAVHKARTAVLMRLGIIAFAGDGQGNFLGGLSAQMPSQEAQEKLALGRVRADGYNTGYAGGLLDGNPCEPGTQAHVAWIEQFRKGAADRAEDKPEAKDVILAAPRKRGRPRKDDVALIPTNGGGKPPAHLN